MTCEQCEHCARPPVELALDDEELYHRLAALRTFEDCDLLIENLHWTEMEHYGDYPSSAVKEW